MRFFLILFLLFGFCYSKTILIIGDSMAEAIYKPICMIFEKNSIKCEVYYKRGTRVDYWLKHKDIFSNTNPEITVITLGTNDLIAKKQNQKIIDELRLLSLDVQKLGIAKEQIFFIAPPISDDNNLNNELKKFFGDNLLESKRLNLVMSKDNIHPTMASDYFWAAYISDWLINHKNVVDALSKN